MSILLSKLEIAEAIDMANGGKEWREGWKLCDVIEEQDYSIAKAQLKKVIDEIRRDNGETLFLLENLVFWNDLVKEIE
ncbi:hypothetical protein LCGC14_0572190 [marine sediment metagenome]|uniref:Uncharacterized protein n=1 Tax=marine sediment metagenome TaxID=412755 RepID=A0A0F9U568_9ZZZZ